VLSVEGRSGDETRNLPCPPCSVRNFNSCTVSGPEADLRAEKERARPELGCHGVDASDQAPSEMRIALYLCNLGAISLVALM
jgi:hypothetical protein